VNPGRAVAAALACLVVGTVVGLGSASAAHLPVRGGTVDVVLVRQPVPVPVQVPVPAGHPVLNAPDRGVSSED
jgi:hypothetical protein